MTPPSASSTGSRLEQSGFDVLEVPDGRAAIELGWVPDGAVLDVDMPYVDGLSVCRYLRALDAALPIVVVSGLEGIHADALAAGATEVLEKPVRPWDRLLGVLRVVYGLLPSFNDRPVG